MQYKIVNGAVLYDGEMVLENIDVEINDGEKIAIVGRNGCGKTTLLKAIMGEVEIEEGTGEKDFRIIKAGKPNIDYLRQTPFEDENTPMLIEVRKVFSDLIEMENRIQSLISGMEKTTDDNAIAQFTKLNERYISLGGLTYQREMEMMIRKFGFTKEDEQKPVSEFSGGQRTKIAFIKMLLSKPDILLLDEPTNHLDIETIRWLEEYLQTYKSTLLIVSHDRMFLDRIVNKVYEIEWGETKCYKGNYSTFEKQKKENHIKQQKDHDAQVAEIARLNRLIERFRYKPTKAKMVQSKIKLVERMQIIDAPDRYDTKTFYSNFQPRMESSRQVLNVSNLVIGYDTPLAKVNVNVEKGEKLGIIGGNGIGKSTFLKTLMGMVKAISGSYTFGYNTEIAYFDQQLAQLDKDDTVFNIFATEYPQLNDTEVRRALGSFQFSGEDVFRTASTLSGGEKVRLTLCKILYKKPNVLILDEPTNHMDIIGKQTLEEILKNYEGTVIFVSHDRYFVNKIADKLLVFSGEEVRFFDVTYAEYEQKMREEAQAQTTQNIKNQDTSKPEKVKYISPKKELDKKKKRMEKIELLMSECEEQISKLNEQIELPENCSNYQKLTEMQNEIDEIKSKQIAYEEEWLSLSEELDKIENAN